MDRRYMKSLEEFVKKRSSSIAIDDLTRELYQKGVSYTNIAKVLTSTDSDFLDIDFALERGAGAPLNERVRALFYGAGADYIDIVETVIKTDGSEEGEIEGISNPPKEEIIKALREIGATDEEIGQAIWF